MSDLDRYKILRNDSDVEDKDVITRIVFDDLDSEVLDSVDIEEDFPVRPADVSEIDEIRGPSLGPPSPGLSDEEITDESGEAEESRISPKKAYWLVSLITAMILFSGLGWLWWDAGSEGNLTSGSIIEKVWRKDRRSAGTVLLKMDPFIVPFTSKEKTIGIVNLEIEVKRNAQFDFLSQIGRAREIIFTFLRESAVSLRREQAKALVERINTVMGNSAVVSIHAIRGKDK